MTRRIADKGKNSEVIQLQNRLLVLRLIQERKVTSRVMLAELTGLKQATITNIVNELLELDYIKETGLIEGNNGRRVKGIELNTGKMRILIARLTSDYFAVGAYDLNGDCLCVKKVFWEGDCEFSNRIEQIRDILIQYRETKCENKPILGVGIVLQGGLTGTAPELYNDRDEDLETYIRRYFYEQLQIDIFVDNTSNMCAFYEWNRLISQNQEVRILVSLSIGYSVDCAVMFEGITLHGRNGKVSHFGHVSIDKEGPVCECGNRGCIKQYISVDAVKRRCDELKVKYPDSQLSGSNNIRDIIKAYYEREPLAVEVYDEVAQKIGVVLSNLINQFEPDEIIFGDEIPNNEEFLDLVTGYTNERLPEKRRRGTVIKIFKEERKTEKDVGMRGMCLYVINEQLKSGRLLHVTVDQA